MKRTDCTEAKISFLKSLHSFEKHKHPSPIFCPYRLYSFTGFFQHLYKRPQKVKFVTSIETIEIRMYQQRISEYISRDFHE